MKTTSLVVGIGATVVLLRFRRYKAVGGAAVGVFSSAATIRIAVVVSMFALVAFGYWEPPIGQIIGDALGLGRTIYDTIGEWLLDKFVGWLDGVAE